MKQTFVTIMILLGAAMLCAVPSVANVTATQRTDGSHMVDVYYDLANSSGGEMTIMLVGSNDNSYSWNFACNMATGDIGQHIYAGNGKHIVWNAAAEYPNISCTDFKFQVRAYDGSIAPYAADFAYVSGGTFTMGNTLGGGSSNETPLHAVTLSSYLIGKYEVTQSQWIAIMGSNPSSGQYGIGDNYPVNTVSWYSILKYCNLRSMAEGLTPAYTINSSTNPANWGSVPGNPAPTWDAVICNWNADGYRLLTEAEWEYAARGGTTNPDYIYSGSSTIGAVGWSVNTGSTSHPVGLLQYNGLGIYDMSGNINEFCWDWYGSYSSEGQSNPTGLSTGTMRVLRGGSWPDQATLCRVSARGSYQPYYANSYGYGFRLCRSVN